MSNLADTITLMARYSIACSNNPHLRMLRRSWLTLYLAVKP